MTWCYNAQPNTAVLYSGPEVYLYRPSAPRLRVPMPKPSTARSCHRPSATSKILQRPHNRLVGKREARNLGAHRSARQRLRLGQQRLLIGHGDCCCPLVKATTVAGHVVASGFAQLSAVPRSWACRAVPVLLRCLLRLVLLPLVLRCLLHLLGGRRLVGHGGDGRGWQRRRRRAASQLHSGENRWLR